MIPAHKQNLCVPQTTAQVHLENFAGAVRVFDFSIQASSGLDPGILSLSLIRDRHHLPVDSLIHRDLK